jgi:ubiquinone/menaquinone biosynthesis C-methylase UbiE
MEGYLNVDHVPFPGAVIFDIDTYGPWPWDDESITEVYSRDLFEHVEDPVHFVTEAHRVLVVGGLMVVIVPDFRSMDAFSDPTHRRFCTPQTFNHWIPGTGQYRENNYGGVAFAADRVSFDQAAGKLTFELRKIRANDPD